MDTPVTTNQDGPPNASPVEDRIAAIVGQRNQAQGQVTNLQTENATLAQKVASLEARITDIQSARTTEPPAGNIDHLLASDAGAPTGRRPSQSTGGQDIAALVEAAVSKAVKPINDRFDKAEDNASLKTKQNASFAQAVELVPDLMDKGSDVAKTAERIWAGRPDLAQLADAPLVIAQIAKGIIADARKADKVTVDRKKQAAVQSPRSPTPRSLGPDSHQELQTAGEEVTERVMQKSAGTTDLADMFRVQLGKELAGAAED
jgi:hypothetical protein